MRKSLPGMGPFSYFSEEPLNLVFVESRCILFDMNGLIVDDEAFQIQALNTVLARFHIAISEETWTRRIFGCRSSDYFRTLLEEDGHAATRAQVAALVREKDELYRDLVQPELSGLLRKGVRELIEYCAARPGVRVALATSASRLELESILGTSGLGLIHRFCLLLCGSDVKSGKPDPEMFLTAADRLQVPAGACLALEDSASGIQAAAAAGMVCLAVPNKFTLLQDFTGAAFVLSDLSPSAGILSSSGLPGMRR